MIKAKLFGSTSVEASEPKTEQSYKESPWCNLQCSGSAQIPSSDNLDDSHRFLSLYKVEWNRKRTVLHIYDTENQIKKVKNLGSELSLDEYTCITQLPNGELFCYGDSYDHTKTLIIDRSYGVRMLPSGIPCLESSALYFDNNIYCFGGKIWGGRDLPLSRKFDLKNNRWISLAELPDKASYCHSVILNRNILISSERNKNLWLYSIEIDSFSIIPYEFKAETRKLLINVEKLYLIERGGKDTIYEGEDEYHWKPISKTPNFSYNPPRYCLYNKGKIYISAGVAYYQFDLKDKKVFQFL